MGRSMVGPPNPEWAAVERGEGTPIVLLHGYPLDHTMWQPQLSSLSRGHHVVLLDLPGYGLARGEPVPETLGGFSDAVSRFLSARFRGPVTLVGHSFGGYVALQLYRDHPEMFAGLALANTRSMPDTEDARRARLSTAERLSDPVEHLDSAALAESLLAPTIGAPDLHLVAKVRAIIDRAPSATVIATLKAIAGRPDLTPVLPEVSVPTAVIWGEEDRLIPPDQSRAMLALIPGSVGVGIPGAGHLPSLEAPAPFGRALRALLSRVERTPGRRSIDRGR